MTQIKSLTYTEQHNITLGIVALERDSLIRQEVKAMNQREKLELACRDAVLKLGHNVDEVSEASGLTPGEIRALVDASQSTENDLKVLAGIV
jgi:hypothetical protein